jgi:hypothetical protein
MDLPSARHYLGQHCKELSLVAPSRGQQPYDINERDCASQQKRSTDFRFKVTSGHHKMLRPCPLYLRKADMAKHYQAAAMELIVLSEFQLFNLPYSPLDPRLGPLSR